MRMLEKTLRKHSILLFCKRYRKVTFEWRPKFWTNILITLLEESSFITLRERWQNVLRTFPVKWKSGQSPGLRSKAGHSTFSWGSWWLPGWAKLKIWCPKQDTLWNLDCPWWNVLLVPDVLFVHTVPQISVEILNMFRFCLVSILI